MAVEFHTHEMPTATAAEVVTGTSDDTAVSPLALAGALPDLIADTLSFSTAPTSVLPNPPVLAIVPEVRRGRFMPEWAKYDSDGSDYAPAINRGLQALDEETNGSGGRMELGRGIFPLSEPIVLNSTGLSIVGQGMGDSSSTPATRAGAPTELVMEFDSGAGIRGYGHSTMLTGFLLQSTATRTASAFDLGSFAIWLEPTATGVGIERSDYTTVRQVRINNNRGDGLYIGGICGETLIEQFDFSGNKGHGLCIDDGTRSGRATARLGIPGIVNINTGKTGRNGGHGWALGHPNTLGGLSGYRFKVENIDSFYNASDAAVRYNDSGDFLFADNSICIKNAHGGAFAGAPTVAVGKGLTVAGRSNLILGGRYIELVNAIHWKVLPVFGSDVPGPTTYWASKGLTVFPMEVRNTGSGVNPAILVDSGCTDFFGVQAGSTSITSYMTASVPRSVYYYNGFETKYGINTIQPVKSGRTIGLADDAVAKLLFSSAQRGNMNVGAGATASGPGVVGFSTTDDPLAGVTSLTIISDPSSLYTVSTSSGVPTGTTGTDGKLNFFTDKSEPAIWVENRTGATRSYVIDFVACNPAGGYLT